MQTQRNVLLVGGSVDTETVLKAVLAAKGVAVRRIRDGEPATQPPDVVVLHRRQDRPEWAEFPCVVIDRDGLPRDRTQSVEHDAMGPLFHYDDLVAAVDGLLDAA